MYVKCIELYTRAVLSFFALQEFMNARSDWHKSKNYYRISWSSQFAFPINKILKRKTIMGVMAN